VALPDLVVLAAKRLALRAWLVQLAVPAVIHFSILWLRFAAVLPALVALRAL
jgi:hypothetical protein